MDFRQEAFLRAVTARFQLITVTLVAAVGFAILGAIVYRAVFHPLSKYPGPFLAKFTNLYSAWHAWKGDIHLDIYRCHQKYGNRVRYAPNRLIINTDGALRDIYGHHSNVVKFRNYEVLSKQAANLLTLRDKTQHGRRRRVISQAFSENSLRIFEPKILSRVDRFCDLMRRGNEPSKDRVPAGHWTGPIDMAHAFNNLAFDIMTSVSFDSEFDTMGSPEYRYAMQAIEDSNVRLGVLIQAPELNFAKMDRKLFPKALVGRYKFVKFIRMVLAKRLGATKTASRDIFSFLQQCKDPTTGKELSTAELSTETATFIVAGADTSSTSMSAVSHYLTGSSSCYRRVVEEVRSTFLSVDEIRMGPKLNSCAFLRACIDESLRMSPPGGSALWREVEDGGALIDGTFIPERTEIAVGVYSIHHSPAYYNDPFCYDPDRWYRPADSKGARNESSRLPYMPFSVGARSCVGKPLAIAQIMIVFARLIWEFDLRRADSDFDWMEKDCTPTEYALRDHLTAWKEGPILSIRPRFSD
ncbi:cytochrome P450 [Drechmeria coniospora]|uniref:Cytochrome P450 n=1 Tax=Drechmeria coniospora TaxID=98403 RepID=A0A151GJV6_DRECN|nr:cytochrome P450 [Drechmeria coniospora]KYK57384.1 cytochrome P450 [Drechmeria coniospora]